MGIYLDALKQKNFSKTPTLTREKTEITTTQPDNSVFSPTYPSVLKNHFINADNSERLDPLEVLQEDKEIDFLHDDLLYLKKLLAGMLFSNRSRLLAEYRQLWVDVMANEPLVHQRQNKGRFAANTWVREQVNSSKRNKNSPYKK